MMNISRLLPSIRISVNRASFSTASKKGFRVDENGRRIWKKTFDNRPAFQKQVARNALLEEKAKASGLEWRIVSATMLHRYPIITKIEPWEKDMFAIQKKIEDAKMAALQSEIAGTPADIIPLIMPPEEGLPTAVYQEDPNADSKSMTRAGSDSLFLVVKRNRNDFQWQFPQGKVLEGETLRGCSERVLKRAVAQIKPYFIGNAPVAYYCYEYPPEVQKARNQFGAKVFIYRAQHLSGNVKLETRLYKDFAWIKRDEVSQYFPEEMQDFVTAILPF